MHQAPSAVREGKSTKRVKLPPDPDGFKRNYEKDQEEILRIFMHMFKKYPSADGVRDAFNRLFVGLYELRVFQKWSVARVVRAEVKRRTGSQRIAQRKYLKLMKAGNDEAERIALEMGVNLKVKRGQFLYKWIEHIMGQEYLNDGLHMRRFSTLEPRNIKVEHSLHDRRAAGFLPWAARERDADPTDHYAGTGVWGFLTNHESRHFPSYDDVPGCVGEHTYAQAMCATDASVIERETMEGINQGTNRTDRIILTKRSQGYTVREIREHIGGVKHLVHWSHQGVLNRIHTIRTKPTTLKVLV